MSELKLRTPGGFTGTGSPLQDGYPQVHADGGITESEEGSLALLGMTGCFLIGVRGKSWFQTVPGGTGLELERWISLPRVRRLFRSMVAWRI